MRKYASDSTSTSHCSCVRMFTKSKAIKGQFADWINAIPL
jgi:hypothetical protein